MIVVVGIGTDVGKTVVSAILVEMFKGEYWKPVQCGNLHFSDSAAIKHLAHSTCIHPEGYRFKAPLSPHHAARLENLEIHPEDLSLPKASRKLIIEGCGGVLVPLNQNTLFIDLLAKWNLPCILVSRHYLGSINHSLLSIEVLKHRRIPTLGILFNGPTNRDSEEIIQKFSGWPILGRLDRHPSINPTLIKHYANSWKNQFILT